MEPGVLVGLDDSDAPNSPTKRSGFTTMTVALRVWLRVWAVVGALFFLSQLAEIPWRSALRGYDNTFNYLWLRSAMVDGDWDFRNDIEEANTLAPAHRASALTLPQTAAGRLPNKYGVGWALVTTPFYWVADAMVGAGRALGLWRLERDGFNAVYQICVQLGHLGLAVLALWLATETIATWIGTKEAARVGVATVWAASPLFYYQTVNLSMSHGVAFFAVAVLAYALTRARPQTHGGPNSREAESELAASAAASREPGPPHGNALGSWLLAGVGWGLAVITRFQLAVFAIPAAFVLFERRRSAGEVMRAAGCFAAGAAPFILLQLWAWRVVYGEWFVFGYGVEGESFHWSRPEVLRALFSPWHGLFYWHPFLLVACAGMIAWAWRERMLALGWVAAWCATIYVGAAWWCWWFASAFGQRSHDAALLPLMAGVAALWKHGGARWRRIIWVLAIAAGAWNFYLATLYRTGAISRSEPVTWMQMIEAAARLPTALHF